MIKLYVGVDIGGTNVKCGIIDCSGKIYKKSNVKIAGLNSAFGVVNATACEVKKMMAETKGDYMGIGVGVPGLIDSNNGIVVRSGNLNWIDEKIGCMFKEHFNLPISIINDANSAALGENRFGIAKNFKHCILITLGTGVGSGIIIDGNIYEGNGSAGGEIGHMSIELFGRKCTCGGRGCLETYASATALKADTAKAMLENPDSKMWEIGDVEKISGKTAFQYADTDQSAQAVVENYIEYLSTGLTNLCNIFRPQAIIIGGGVSQEGERLIAPLKQKMNQRMFAGECSPQVQLLTATLKNDAGFMGAASLNIK